MGPPRVGGPLLAAALLLAGCASPLPHSDAIASKARAEFGEEHRRRARALEAKGDLRGALDEWRMIRALLPGSSEAEDKSSTLEREINARTTIHVTRATGALGRGHTVDARTAALKALALQPGNQKAIELLRAIEVARVSARLANAPRQSETSSGGPGYSRRPSGVGTNHPEDEPHHGAYGGSGQAVGTGSAGGSGAKNDAGGTTASMHLELGLKYRGENKLEKALEQFMRAKERGEAPRAVVDSHIAETKLRLAERHYREGVGLFRSDLERSVEAFRRALSYDPEHAKAQSYLSTALRLQKQRADRQAIGTD